MRFPRSSGILLHPSSFPGRYGIGDFGDAAYEFVDFLVKAGQSWWQLLPLGPTGYGDSPYQSFSSFAGNVLLISPDYLVRDGYLPATAVQDVPNFPMGGVDFGWVIDYKTKLL
jgi:4-alpha-glucanotransferase